MIAGDQWTALLVPFSLRPPPPLAAGGAPAAAPRDPGLRRDHRRGARTSWPPALSTCTCCAASTPSTTPRRPTSRPGTRPPSTAHGTRSACTSTHVAAARGRQAQIPRGLGGGDGRVGVRRRSRGDGRNAPRCRESRMTAVERAAARRYRDFTGRAPDGLWSAPGRVNLIGEHTDYNDGFVLPFAIDRRTVVALGRRDDGLLRVVVLTAMRGEFWVDTTTFQWVRASALVLRPVSIDGFSPQFNREQHSKSNKCPCPATSGFRSTSRSDRGARSCSSSTITSTRKTPTSTTARSPARRWRAGFMARGSAIRQRSTSASCRSFSGSASRRTAWTAASRTEH